MNRIYTFEQIVFALRKEYLETEKQLNQLKKYVEITGKIDDVNFRLTDTRKMRLFLTKKQTFLDKIKKELGLYIYGAYNHDVTTDMFTSYYIGKKEVCSISNVEELRKNIKDIIESDFSQNIVINNKTSIPCNENNNTSLLITPLGMGLSNYCDDDSNERFSCFLYDSSEDAFTLINKEKNITLDEIYKLFSLSFASCYFNDYHYKLLDNYQEKELDIEDKFDNKYSKLEIIEEPKKLILRPKKMVK